MLIRRLIKTSDPRGDTSSFLITLELDTLNPDIRKNGEYALMYIVAVVSVTFSCHHTNLQAQWRIFRIIPCPVQNNLVLPNRVSPDLLVTRLVE